MSEKPSSLSEVFKAIFYLILLMVGVDAIGDWLGGDDRCD